MTKIIKKKIIQSIMNNPVFIDRLDFTKKETTLILDFIFKTVSESMAQGGTPDFADFIAFKKNKKNIKELVQIISEEWYIVKQAAIDFVNLTFKAIEEMAAQSEKETSEKEEFSYLELEELIEKCSHNEYIEPTNASEAEPKYVAKAIKLQSNDKYKSFKADRYVKNLSGEVYFNRAIFRGLKAQIEEAVKAVEAIYLFDFSIKKTITPDIYELYVPQLSMPRLRNSQAQHNSRTDIVEKILADNPALKMVSFYNSPNEGYVVFSQPGYSHLTEVEFISYLDPYSEPNYIWNHQPTDSFHEKIEFIQSGEYNSINYSFPFEKQWKRFDYLIPDGDDYMAIVEITLPDGIQQLEDYAYSDSKYLKKIFLPRSMKAIGRKAFSECNRSLKIYYSNK